MKFWYSSIAAIFLFVLSFSNLEQLQNPFAVSIEELAFSNEKHQNWHINNIPEEEQERKKEEKEENNDPEEDNKEEKDSEEEKREKESQNFPLLITTNHIAWEIFHAVLPTLYITVESNDVDAHSSDLPLYVLFVCLKVNC